MYSLDGRLASGACKEEAAFKRLLKNCHTVATQAERNVKSSHADQLEYGFGRGDEEARALIASRYRHIANDCAQAGPRTLALLCEDSRNQCVEHALAITNDNTTHFEMIICPSFYTLLSDDEIKDCRIGTQMRQGPQLIELVATDPHGLNLTIGHDDRMQDAGNYMMWAHYYGLCDK